MTDERTALRLQVLESLGTPLLLAVDEMAGAAGGTTEKEAAEKIAALLNRAVQGSIILGESLKLRENNDAERVVLAGLAARLVAAHYAAQGGRIPEEAEIARLGGAVDAILSFADNFAAGAEGRARLQMLDAGAGMNVAQPDETQLAVQFVAALLPVVNAVADFSFGRPEKKLLQEIAARLNGDAEDLCRDIHGDHLAPGLARQAELQCLRMLAAIYATCHRAETAHLAGLSEADRERIAVNGQIPLEPVWEAYNLRLAMVSILGAAEERAPASGDGSRPAPQQAAPQAAPQAMPQAAPVSPPAASAATPEAAAPANPMSFFAKKSDDSQTGEG